MQGKANYFFIANEDESECTQKPGTLFSEISPWHNFPDTL